MNPEQTLQRCLIEVARRRRLHQVLSGVTQGLVWGGLVSLLGLATYKLLPIPIAIPYFTAVLGLLILAWFSLRPFLQKVSPLQTARWVDLQLNLKERISTALELLSDPKHRNSEWGNLVSRDALQCTALVSPEKLLPFRWPKQSVWSAATLVALLILLLVPEYRTPARLQREKESTHAIDTGQQMAASVRQLLQEKKPVQPVVEQSIEEVIQLGDEMARLAPGKNEALRDLTSLQQKLEQQWKEMEDKPAVKSLQKAAQNGSTPTAAAPDLARKMEELKQKLGAAADQQAKIEAMKDKLNRMEAAAKDLQQNHEDTKAAREAMAKDLAAMAAEARQSGLPGDQLEAAAEALRNADAELFARDLQAAMTDLDKLQEMQQSLQQMQDQMEKLAQTLSEQLEKSQLRAAQQSLEKMMQQLRSADPSREPLEKMAQELSKSLKHAQDLGKVPEHLQKALEALQKCNNPGAGQGEGQQQHRDQANQHLADAAKELQSLLEQMGDAEQLNAAMEALQKAQMAMGTGQSFGQCKNPGRMGKNGKPGRGVGTWAEDDGWQGIPENSEGWDNSGLNQPEMQSRGLTDRGDPDLNPNLEPTKVQGKISPGQSMPSVPLKGFHIKGSSQVRYQEAAGAAQSDAQKALNQDKVPKVYQKAVRDYFDDLK